MPGEYRAMLRRLIVIQGDTEPASVEQQRHLGATAPSLYDLRNLFQVNVEEGRHLWAMVYLLHKYFGRDGREEAENCCAAAPATRTRRACSAPSTRRRRTGCPSSCSPSSPTATARCSSRALAQSGFDPLSRTCRFMLTEEAHHMFVGETGVGRTIQRTCEAMKEAGIADPNDIARMRALGVIDLPTIQKKLNLHFSLTLDLFGTEISTNSANYYNAGLKGRFGENKIDDDHQLTDAVYPVLKLRRRRDREVTCRRCPR